MDRQALFDRGESSEALVRHQGECEIGLDLYCDSSNELLKYAFQRVGRSSICQKPPWKVRARFNGASWMRTWSLYIFCMRHIRTSTHCFDFRSGYGATIFCPACVVNNTYDVVLCWKYNSATSSLGHLRASFHNKIMLLHASASIVGTPIPKIHISFALTLTKRF